MDDREIAVDKGQAARKNTGRKMTTPETYRFQELKIQGFRRLYDIQLNLRPLSVIIGANGVGKTSILDVLSMLANSAHGKLSESLSDLSGLNNVLTYDRSESLHLGISMTVPGHKPLDYSLRLRPQGVAYTISEERLSQIRPGYLQPFFHIDSYGPDIRYYEVTTKKLTKPFQPNWAHNPLETSLYQVPKMFQQPEDFRNRLSSSTFYHVLNVDPRSPVRLPQPMQPATLPGRNGEELVSCLFYLREAERDRFDAIEDALRAAFLRFERLDFPPVAAGTLALAWRESGFSKPLYMHQLSEGTLRFLWLATLLQSPGLTALTLIDEPEVSLHPELLSQLAEMLREASKRTQLVLATHSDRLIRFLQPKEVVVVDADESGMSTMKWADELDLAVWLNDYSLDELWSNGRLGARA
jgi:predicted ATPase